MIEQWCVHWMGSSSPAMAASSSYEYLIGRFLREGTGISPPSQVTLLLKTPARCSSWLPAEGHILGRAIMRNTRRHDKSSAPSDQGRDLWLIIRADGRIAFPEARHGTILGLGRAACCSGPCAAVRKSAVGTVERSDGSGRSRTQACRCTGLANEPKPGDTKG